MKEHRKPAGPLFNAVIITAALLGMLFAYLLLYLGRGRFIGNIAWYSPMMHSFVGLAAFCVAFLSFGRYHVLRSPAPYWIGTGFATFGVLSVFFVLTWPGLLPGEQGLIARLPSTSAWTALFGLSCLGVFLLLSVGLKWPREKTFQGRNWLWPVGAWLAAASMIAFLAARFEQFLPPLVGAEGNFIKPLFVKVWIIALALVFVVGVVLSARRYLQSGDALVGYVAITQVTLVFAILTVIIGQKQYDLWYYLLRVILAGGSLTMMFGLLSDYVRLFRHEQEKTREKEILLKELYHRTKNNMYVITSLIDLQARQTKNGATAPVFMDIKNRIQSMALVHEKLYASKDLSRLKAGEYVRELAAAVMGTYKGTAKRVSFELNAEDVDLDLGTAIPIGLVLNELMTNSMKYAFPADRTGKIMISLSRDRENLRIEYSDNGIGLPVDIDISKTASLGFVIVYNLINKQLQGRIENKRTSQGTEFEIVIPIGDGRKEIHTDSGR